MKIRAELRIYEIFINNLKKSVTSTILYYSCFLLAVVSLDTTKTNFMSNKNVM